MRLNGLYKYAAGPTWSAYPSKLQQAPKSPVLNASQRAQRMNQTDPGQGFWSHFYNDYTNRDGAVWHPSKSVQDNLRGYAETGGEVIGGTIGAAGGLVGGGAAGTAVAPGVGTVAGGVTGGFAGGYAGSKAGKSIGRNVFNYFAGSTPGQDSFGRSTGYGFNNGTYGNDFMPHIGDVAYAIPGAAIVGAAYRPAMANMASKGVLRASTANIPFVSNAAKAFDARMLPKDNLYTQMARGEWSQNPARQWVRNTWAIPSRNTVGLLNQSSSGGFNQNIYRLMSTGNKTDAAKAQAMFNRYKNWSHNTNDANPIFNLKDYYLYGIDHAKDKKRSRFVTPAWQNAEHIAIGKASSPLHIGREIDTPEIQALYAHGRQNIPDLKALPEELKVLSTNIPGQGQNVFADATHMLSSGAVMPKSKPVLMLNQVSPEVGLHSIPHETNHFNDYYRALAHNQQNNAVTNGPSAIVGKTDTPVFLQNHRFDPTERLMLEFNANAAAHNQLPKWYQGTNSKREGRDMYRAIQDSMLGYDMKGFMKHPNPNRNPKGYFTPENINNPYFYANSVPTYISDNGSQRMKELTNQYSPLFGEAIKNYDNRNLDRISEFPDLARQYGLYQ